MRRLLLIAILSGCVTPSIPIPPPDPAKMEFDVTAIDQAPSTAVFTYPATDNYRSSTVYLFNRDQGVGVIEVANVDGSVGPTPPLAANLGDQIVVTFQREDQTVSTCIRLRQGSQSATDYCD